MKKKINLILLGTLVILALGNYAYADIVSPFDPIFDAISYGFKPVMLIIIGLLVIIGISSLIIKNIQNDSLENSDKKEGE